MKNSKPKILISGYYGFSNFGDEAVLSVLINSLKDSGLEDITVFSKNPEMTKQSYDVKVCYSFSPFELLLTILKTDVLISGGGSLLQDATSAKSLVYYLGIILTALFFGKKVMIFAQGIGPIKNKFLEKLTVFALKKCKYVTVRDEKSLSMLKSHGISADLVSDPVWNIKLWTKYSHRGVGIQLRRWEALTEEFFMNLVKYVAEVYSDKIIFIYALQESLDIDICNRFEEELLKINPDLHTHVVTNRATFEIVKSFSHLDELIAMRYHACLLGLKYDIRVLPIIYDPKVEKLADEFNIKSRLYLNGETEIGAKIRDLRYGEYEVNSSAALSKQLDFKPFVDKIIK
ncbi:MAG: polysaccharide pyruvyl transferase CsaB [Candidatus Gastranaerophilales bacterium]|nr:polysaccharide pyruvyl transferase CsaB [Candidatus Gastranaerophilales bacterium]